MALSCTVVPTMIFSKLFSVMVFVLFLGYMLAPF